MTNEKLYEIIGDINEKHIKEAKKHNHINWNKWGAVAACLCLIAGIAFLRDSNRISFNETEEMDPIVADMAVFPDDESITNVSDVSMNSISETEAYNVENLGQYLPTTLPNGYQFSYSSLYKTVMKDGSIYYRLRTTYSYTDNTPSESYEEDIVRLDFSVSVMNYRPKTDSKIYTPDTLPKSISENDMFIFKFEDVYIEIISGELSYDEIRSVINSIH